MTYQPDPDRPPQPSGRTDVQVVEQVSNMLAAMEVRLTKQTALAIEKAVREGFAVYAPIFDTVMEGRLKGVYVELAKNNEMLGRANARFDNVYMEIDQTKAAVTALDTRLTASEEAGAVLVGTSPTLRTLARQWLWQILRPWVFGFGFVLLLLVVSQSFFWARALGWLHGMGL